jgi:hypothetical protein
MEEEKGNNTNLLLVSDLSCCVIYDDTITGYDVITGSHPTTSKIQTFVTLVLPIAGN